METKIEYWALHIALIPLFIVFAYTCYAGYLGVRGWDMFAIATTTLLIGTLIAWRIEKLDNTKRTKVEVN